MKSLFVLLATCFGVSAVGFAQCVPSTTFNGTGLTFSPNILEPVYACATCGDHVRVISVQTFADTTLSVEVSPGNPPLAVTVFADFFRLDSIGGLPEGLTYTTDAAFDTTYDAVTDPFGYWINPGDTTTGFSNTTGCISIEGDAAAWTAAAGGGPNSDGIYPLTLFIDARAANFYPAAIGGVVGFNTWLTEMGALLDAFGDPNFTVNGIRLEGAMLEVLESGVGINESEPTVTNISVYPNPSNDLATISYQAFEREVGYVRIFNALGESVYQESVSTIAGNNSLNVDCSKMESGLYIVMLEFETQSHNLKLLVP